MVVRSNDGTGHNNTERFAGCICSKNCFPGSGEGGAGADAAADAEAEAEAEPELAALDLAETRRLREEERLLSLRFRAAIEEAGVDEAMAVLRVCNRGAAPVITLGRKQREPRCPKPLPRRGVG